MVYVQTGATRNHGIILMNINYFLGHKVNKSEELLVEEEEINDDGQIDEYDLTSSPNDFNVMTINSFIESGSIEIPGFQRNYVWDIKKASRLIESLILGLPVPQIFLYEIARNKFLVIDGQQRLMSIYYFIKKRFPKKEKRAEIRKLFAEHNGIPDSVIDDDDYFQPFKLVLSKSTDPVKSKFNGLNYGTLGDYKAQFDLRPIRNVIVKQNAPKDGDSSVYEIFSRLNSGGVNLMPQEIRGSLYHSKFYDMLANLNYSAEWRAALKMDNLDLHMKDVEMLLRCFAIAVEYKDYKPSLANFLNEFSKKARNFDEAYINYLKDLFGSFLKCINSISPDRFVSQKSRRFNIFLFETLFAVLANKVIADRKLIDIVLSDVTAKAIVDDHEFSEACIAGTTNAVNVKKRIEIVEKALA